MGPIEYFTAKMAAKKVSRGSAFMKYFAKAAAEAIVKAPIKFVGFILKNLFNWMIWVITKILPAWVRAILFFVFLYFIYISYHQFKDHGGFKQIIDNIVSLLIKK